MKLGILAASFIVFLPKLVWAQEPALPAPAPNAPPVAPAVASPATVDRYQGSDDIAQSGDVRCVLRRSEGIKTSDARTGLALACLAIKQAGAAGGDVAIDFGTLGTRVAVSVTREGAPTKTVLIQSIEEMPTGAERLAHAFVHGGEVKESGTPDTVLASETLQTRTKGGQPSAEMGVFGQTAVGRQSDASAGVDIGLAFRFGRLAPASHLRASGISSGDHRISGASLDVGGRYYFSDGDFAPFAGAGLGASYISIRDTSGGLSGSGVGAYAELGATMLRSGKVGFYASLRADVPFYSLQGTTYTAGANYASSTRSDVTAFAVPISLNTGLTFR